jgi:glycerate 2-kinase
MAPIKNKDKLITNGATEQTQKAREIALGAFEHVLNSVDAAKLFKSNVTLKNHQLHAGKYSLDLNRFRNIYVVGGGKAAAKMALALEGILGNNITEGYVNVPHGDETKTRSLKLHGASHPVPDEAGETGTRRMMEIAEKADKNDMVIVLLSGGGSSLMPLPRGSVTLQDKRELTAELLKSGASIDEINTVRKHLSGFKGGWLAKKACPATVLNLIISDVVGDPLEAIASGPTVPDPTTFTDAREVLQRYRLWATAPSSVQMLIADGEQGLVEETPKPGDECFKKVHSVVLGNCRTAAVAAVELLRAEGLNAVLLTTSMEGEAKTVGVILGSIAAEIAASGNPVPKPAAVIVSGETVVTVGGKGKGGRNQELSLSAAPKLHGIDGAVVASLSTDGIDGPTDAAGAIVDGNTVERAKRLGLDLEEPLAENDSYGFFSRLGDLIITGPTGTNVNDISLIVIL